MTHKGRIKDTLLRCRSDYLSPTLRPPMRGSTSRMSERRRILIARRITEARENLGMTQEEVAYACGFYRTTLARWETGENVPSARSMRKLAENLGVPIPYLRAAELEEEEEPVHGTS